jgi:hypothetical protein
VDWTYLVEKGDKWWAVMNAVMDIWVPQNECFSRLTERSFHRRTPWRLLFNLPKSHNENFNICAEVDQSLFFL